MKTKFFVLIFGMLLAGCTGIPIKTGIDTKTVTLVRDYDANRICSALSGKKAEACTVVHENYCTIIQKPDTSNEVWGHELRHCFDGAWH